MAKVADVFGRTEAFSVSVFLYTLGFIMMAGSKDIGTYAASQIFYAAGFTGMQILQQIFIADTSDLTWRGFWSALPDVPFLITVWIGSYIAADILGPPPYLGSWQWGFGMWAIVLPVAFIPLAVSLFLNQRKAARRGILPPAPWKVQGYGPFFKSLWFDMDIGGLTLLTAGFSLILIPLTLASQELQPYSQGGYIAMFVIGGIAFIAWPLWENSSKLAPRPAVPFRLLKDRTVAIGCLISFLYFMAFYLCVYPYYYSWLLVVNNTGIVASGHILNTFSFSSTVTALVVGILIKYTKHYKFYVTFGACLYVLGIGLLYHYRQPGTSVSTLVGLQICMGIGGGLITIPAQVGVQSVSKHKEVAMVTSLFLTTLELGGAIGQGISGSVWTQNLEKKLTLYLPEANKVNASLIYSELTVEAYNYPIGSDARIAINRAVNETMQMFMIGALVCSAAIIPLSLLLKNIKLDQVSY
jgi:MFS family permease